MIFLLIENGMKFKIFTQQSYLQVTVFVASNLLSLGQSTVILRDIIVQY